LGVSGVTLADGTVAPPESHREDHQARAEQNHAGEQNPNAAWNLIPHLVDVVDLAD